MWISLIIYFCLIIIFFWSFSDISPFGRFKYSYLRSLLISVILVNLISITSISVGFIQSFRVVSIFITLNLLISLIILGSENR
jgi:hypothetical protein